MKPVILTFTDQDGKPTKTYSTCSIKSGLFTKLIPIAERAKEFQESDSYGASEIGAFLVEVEALIVDAFGRQFTIDELQAGVEITELFRVIAELFSAINVKKPGGRDGEEVEPAEPADMLTFWIGLKVDISKAMGWSLHEIDECDVESLTQFFGYRDPDVRVIDGKVYERAKGPASWL